MRSPRYWKTRRRALSVMVIFGLGAVLPTSITAFNAQTTSIAPFSSKPTGKLSTRLAQLAQPSVAAQDAATLARTLSLPKTGPGSLLTNERGELMVYVRLATVTDVNLRALSTAGARIVHVARDYRVLTAYVAPDRLNVVAAVAAVENMREELQPATSSASASPAKVPSTAPLTQVSCAGAITSEGDAHVRADQARMMFPIDGAAVTVGVLSNSYNINTGDATDEVDDIRTGDLPGPGNPCGRTTPVNIIDEGNVKGYVDEGRALAQIVHDLAPGATINFATANDGMFAFADNIRSLRDQTGADVLVDDISYYAEPFYQDGPISVAIQDVTAQGALYFTSAGNDHVEDASGNPTGSYEATAYRPMTCPVLTFENGTTVDALDCHNFNPTGMDNTMRLTLEPQTEIPVIFQWAEPWFGVTADLDIYLADDAGRVLASSRDVNNETGTQMPFEAFTYYSPNNIRSVSLIIARVTGTATPRLKYSLRVRPIDRPLIAEYTAANSNDTFGPTIFGHHGEDTALSIAAVPYTTTTTPALFTSRGPVTYLFEPVVNDMPGAPLPAPEVRSKPDVAASSGGRTTFFDVEVSPGVFRFGGTSASAPHAAAVAALMKQRAIQRGLPLGQANAEAILESTAALVANGAPQATGAGLIDARAAVNAVNASAVYRGYLPWSMQGTTGPAGPDLVGSFNLSPHRLNYKAGEPVKITAVITNQGNGAADPFWTDLFINPSPPPSAVNMIWDKACGLKPCFGIAWAVERGLGPGESVTLTSSSNSFATGHTIWPGYFASGTTDLYLYVDSWNPGVATGAAAESDETNNRVALHGLRVTGPNPAQPGQQARDLPLRPAQP